jgi:hypothetical protein
VSVAGEEFDRVDDLAALIHDRGRKGETVEFQLERQSTGPFTTQVGLDDYSRRTDIYVPLLFRLDDEYRETYWRFGPLGMIANYHGEYEESSNRETNYVRQYSMLLGLIKYRWWPTGSTTRLLWFIKLGSS